MSEPDSTTMAGGKSFRPRSRPSSTQPDVALVELDAARVEQEATSDVVQHQLQALYGAHAVQSALDGSSADPFSTVIVAEWALGVAELPGLLGTSNDALNQIQATLHSPEYAEACAGIISRHAQGRGGPVHMERALELIRASRGQRLPADVAGRLSQVLGTDISDARVHTDGAAAQAAKAVNAHAFATGKDIFFASNQYKPGTREGDELLLHELTHVIQDAEGRLPGASTGAAVEVSSPTDSHEREAVRTAASAVDRLYSGDGVEGLAVDIDAPVTEAGVEASQVSQAPASGGALHRAVENPTAPADTNPNDTRALDHRPIKLSDGYSTGGSQPSPAVSGTIVEGEKEVRIIHSKTNPLKRAESGVADDDLFEVVPGVSGDECTSDAVHVDTQWGTGHDPHVEAKAADDALFIGDGPRTEDVRQGNLGDCYFLAALLNILNQDPERVRRCISVNGNNVDFTFWVTSDQGTTWTQETITTDRTALQQVDTSDPSIDYAGLHGAGARVGPSAAASEYYAEASDDILSVTRVDVYEMALWAPLMEKAYARLSEKNNQYGGFRTGNQVNSTGGGYEQIDGGFERWVYGIFYGPDLHGIAKVDVHHRPGEDLVLQNPATIQTLLYHQGYRATRGATPTAATHVMVSASISGSEAVKRLIATIDHCSALPQMRRYRSLKTILEQIKGLAATYQGRVDAGASNAIQGAAMNRLSAGCERQVASGAWPMLEDPNSDKIWHDLHESLAIVGNLGTDSSNGTRNIYANHAYPVVGVEFLGHDGRPLTLNVDSLATDLANVSGENSRVVLRNPHQTNEPNLPSSMVDQNTEDGIFKMSLDSYLRAFSLQEMAHVKDT